MGLGQLTRLTRLQLLNSKGFQPILLSGMLHLEVRGGDLLWARFEPSTFHFGGICTLCHNCKGWGGDG